MMTWGHPWYALLLPLPILVWRLLPAHRQMRAALAAPFFDRYVRLTGAKPDGTATASPAGWPTVLCAVLFWCLTIAALARPQWLEPPITRAQPVRDMLLAVDLSGSMETKDFTDASGKTVDRLSAVKQILDDFLKERRGDRVGLIVFGNAAFVQAPFTDDIEVCRSLLADLQVGMAGPQTAFGDALGLAINVFERSTVEQRVLIALTDGNDTASQVPPAEAARIAHDRGIVIHTVAVGDPQAAGEEKLDEETLRKVATTTGGLYSHAADREELQSIYDKLNTLETRNDQTISHRPRRELFHWPLAAGFIFLLLPAAWSLIPGSRSLLPQHEHTQKAAA